MSESESEVAQLCPALCDPVDCSSPGSSVHGILQSRILEWVAIQCKVKNREKRKRQTRGSKRTRGKKEFSLQFRKGLLMTVNILIPIQFISVQSISHVQLFANPWTAARQSSLSITNSRSLLKLMSIESMMPANHLILCRPLLLPPSIFPSIRVFSNESVLCIRWTNY